VAELGSAEKANQKASSAMARFAAQSRKTPAKDAYVRDYKTFAPADCIVLNTAVDNDHALRQIKTVLNGDVAVSTRLRFHSGSRAWTTRRR
jgi:hypothetical protein